MRRSRAALQIDEDEVRERAHSAIEELAGEPADELERSERERIGDYLLAQQSAEERLITYDELDGSPAASAFARAAADELAAISDATLPEIPDAEDGARPRSPRRAAVPPPSPKPQRAKAPRKPRGGPRERPPAEPEVPRAPRPARESGRRRYRARASAGRSARPDRRGRDRRDRAREHFGGRFARAQEPIFGGGRQHRRDRQHRHRAGAPQQAAEAHAAERR